MDEQEKLDDLDDRDVIQVYVRGQNRARESRLTILDGIRQGSVTARER